MAQRTKSFIEIKYDNMRQYIKGGDIILFHGTSIISKIIQWGDSCYWNHVGVVIECDGALGICDANGNGVQWDRLSWRIMKYGNGGNFVIIRPMCNNELIEQQLKLLLAKSDRKWIKYDFYNGIKELFNRRFNTHLKVNLKDDKAICSTEDAMYAISLGVVVDKFKNETIQFPQDYIRYINHNNAKIFGI
jgi:hypothetical protein